MSVDPTNNDLQREPGAIREIPLFPLNMVLFPGMPLQLQVFEPRYRALVEKCMKRDRMFGVALIQSGKEVGERAEVWTVGTTAHIERVEKLGDGRLALFARGVQRFRILKRPNDDPYPRAVVSFLAEEENAPDALIDEVQGALGNYLEVLARREGYNWDDLVMPNSALVLSYVVGAVLPCSLPEKQRILDEDDSARRLEMCLPMLETAAHEQRNAPPKVLRARPYEPELNFNLN